jgi:hypothetical protein
MEQPYSSSGSERLAATSSRNDSQYLNRISIINPTVAVTAPHRGPATDGVSHRRILNTDVPNFAGLRPRFVRCWTRIRRSLLPGGLSKTGVYTYLSLALFVCLLAVWLYDVLQAFALQHPSDTTQNCSVAIMVLCSIIIGCLRSIKVSR